MTLETLTAFFGWMTAINISLLLLMTLAMITLKDFATSLHARLFDLDPAQVRHAFYTYLAGFKIAVIVLNLTPYLALRVVA